MFHRLGPYHCARLRALAAAGPVVAIEVVRKDTTNLWDVIDNPVGFRRVRLFPELNGGCAPTGELRRRLHRCLQQERPQAVAVPGWSAPYALLVLSWCLSTQTPAVLMSESTPLDMRAAFQTDRLKRRLLRLYAAALVGGARQAEYLRQLGFPTCATFLGYDVVDNAHFERPQCGTGAAPSNRRSFLVCCRFVPVKNLGRLLAAYARYRQLAGKEAWELVVVGDGPERSRLLRLSRELELDGCVRFPGSIQYEELPAVYGQAGAFILPSVSEPWGLVVNEAITAGLPVLISNRCDCAPDLVEERGNGFTFDPYDVDGLARLMFRISAMSEDQRQAMGRRGREIIRHWGPERFAEGMRKAVETALSAPRPRASLLDRALLWALIHRAGAFL